MAPKLRHRLPKERGWGHRDHLHRVVRRVQGQEAGLREGFVCICTKQTDWHLEFSMDDHPLPLDLTIYGAIHQHELRKKKAGSGSALPPHLLWQGVYTIKFKKVSGPAGGSGESSEPVTRSRSPTPSLSSLPEDAPHAKILRLLRVLHRLNVVEAERQH